jgi:hypothetical protein
MTNGSSEPVDCLAFMGGFPYVVAKALGSKDKDPVTGKPIHKGLWLYIEPWVQKRDNATKEKIKTIFSAFSDVEKEKILKTVQEETLFFFAALSAKQKKVWLIFPKAFDCKRYDMDGYGFFGKSGAIRLQKDDFLAGSHIVASSGQDSAIGHVPERLLWAFVQEAANAVNSH